MAYGISVSNDLKSLYNRLFEEIEKLPENKEKRTWNLMIAEAIIIIAAPNTEEKRDQLWGIGANFVVMKYDENGNNPTEVTGAQPELIKATDMLYCLHKEEIKDVVLEYETMSTLNTTPYNINHLHIAVPSATATSPTRTLATSDAGTSSHVFYVAANDTNILSPSYRPIPIQKEKRRWWLDSVSSEFKAIAARSYRAHISNPRTFTNEFINYKEKGYNTDDLNDHFKQFLGPSPTTPEGLNNRIICAMEELLKEFIPAQSVGICANMIRESDLLPKALNTKGGGNGAIGVCQWRAKRQSTVRDLLNNYMGTSYGDIRDFSLAQQVRGAILEMQSKTDSQAHTAYINIQKMSSSRDVADEFLIMFERGEKEKREYYKGQNYGYINTINRVMGYS